MCPSTFNYAKSILSKIMTRKHSSYQETHTLILLKYTYLVKTELMFAYVSEMRIYECGQIILSFNNEAESTNISHVYMVIIVLILLFAYLGLFLHGRSQCWICCNIWPFLNVKQVTIVWKMVTPFVEGWDFVQTLGEGAYGE